jgi:hypothetical protein
VAWVGLLRELRCVVTRLAAGSGSLAGLAWPLSWEASRAHMNPAAERNTNTIAGGQMIERPRQATSTPANGVAYRTCADELRTIHRPAGSQYPNRHNTAAMGPRAPSSMKKTAITIV